MSISPRPIPRLTTPSVKPASIVFGKIVTMSNFIPSIRARRAAPLLVQFQQTFGRVDSDPARRDVNLSTDVGGKRNQYFAPRPVDRQQTPGRTTFDPPHEADSLSGRGLDRAPHQLMLVIRARRERVQ